MIEFQCNKRRKDQTPVISNDAINNYAELLLSDYKPKLLKEPGKINPYHFVESYLGATLDYQDIYYPEDNPIAGATIFNDARIKVFDRENSRTATISVSADTILLDNDTMKEGSEGFALFTCLHEGGHFCMHPEVYKDDANQISLFSEENQKGKVVACCRSVLEGGLGKRPQEWTELDWREHQANIFAASIAMPRATFISFTKELIHKAGYIDGIWVDEEKDVLLGGKISWEAIQYYSVFEGIKMQIADTFGVSRSAAFVQMKKLGLYISKAQYAEKKQSLFSMKS